MQKARARTLAGAKSHQYKRQLMFSCWTHWKCSVIAEDRNKIDTKLKGLELEKDNMADRIRELEEGARPLQATIAAQRYDHSKFVKIKLRTKPSICRLGCLLKSEFSL